MSATTVTAPPTSPPDPAPSPPHDGGPAEGELRGRLVRGAGWTALVIACYFVAERAEVLGVPAPSLLTGLVAGIALALPGLVGRPFPRGTNRAAQALVGVLMGSYLDSQVLGVLGAALPMLAVTVATIVLCVGAAAVLARFGKLGLTDATLGMVPGGSAAVVSCADDLGADSRIVAFSQYLRVGLVGLTAPAIALGFAPQDQNPADDRLQPLLPVMGHLVDSADQPGRLVVLAAICLTGFAVGRRLGLPAPVLLGPMLVAAVFTLTGASSGFAPAGPLKDVVFIVVGLEVGLRFTRSAARHAAGVFPHLLAATVGVCVACAGLAWGLAALVGIPFTEAYLATTPGGINAVLATAESTGTNVPLVSTVQSLRLFVVVLAVPLVVRALEASRRRRQETVG
ncbi:AbrB family transcriptional regulator [Pseudonocardia sp. T1-2H]|uniref:AbrB family transcriptional regulator n=1 Tax=Pseudonocardia sp. T1-2H TaxID=3128899 RepID=UPI0031014122